MPLYRQKSSHIAKIAVSTAEPGVFVSAVREDRGAKQ